METHLTILIENATEKTTPTHNQIQSILEKLIKTPQMQRLTDIGMHCGCEYTSYPIYANEKYRYTRLLHSIGVSQIVYRFTHDLKQTIAGLLHDIATPVFSHTIDFMNNDHMEQESTERYTIDIIKNSPQVMKILEENAINIEEVSDYHKYPIADNDTPMLSADRLEYTLGNGYNIHNTSQNLIKGMCADLIVAANEQGTQELCFQTTEIARQFTKMSLRNSYFYVSDADRYSMQNLADLLHRAIESEIILPEDLYTTETKVIAKLKNDQKLNKEWEDFTQITSVSASPAVLCDRYCVNIDAKKRYIDPLVMTENGPERMTRLDKKLSDEIQAFLQKDFNYWIYED